MSTDDTQTQGEHGQTDDRSLLEGAIRGVLESVAPTALATDRVAAAVDAPPETVGERLDAMASAGEVERAPFGDGSTGWVAPGDTVTGYAAANSYVVTDRTSGLVTRADTRPGAYRRLADRLDQFERGDHVGAQILGIAERVMSPAYLDSYQELVEDYVRPDDRHLYVYVEGDGVVEIDTETALNRSQSILGFALTGVYDRESFAASSVVPIDRIFAETPIQPEHFPLGVFKLSAVHPDHQRKGVGRALGTHGMAYLASHPPVVTMLWDRTDNPGNVKLTESYPGTEHLGTFPDATPLDQRCPVCGFGRTCQCGTTLYGWGFDVVGDGSE